MPHIERKWYESTAEPYLSCMQWASYIWEMLSQIYGTKEMQRSPTILCFLPQLDSNCVFRKQADMDSI